MKKSLLVFLLFGLFSCMRQVPVVILEYPPQMFESMDSVRIEQRITRHMSGRVQELFYVFEDSLGNEVSHGPNITYYLDGLKKQVQYYRKGNLWGPASYWFNNGQRQGISFYKEGKLDGVAKVWDKQGRLQSVKYWKQGKLHGPQTEYGVDGKIVKQVWWKNNKMVPAPAPAEVVDTVHTDSLTSMSLLPDTLPVPLADTAFPAARPQYFPVPQK